jgi:hypothetical protein
MHSRIRAERHYHAIEKAAEVVMRHGSGERVERLRALASAPNPYGMGDLHQALSVHAEIIAAQAEIIDELAGGRKARGSSASGASKQKTKA